MGEKSVQKKRYIVEKARDVFMEKGFKKVTMKDIVEACDISRGGLYLYFESTSQIFMEVLRMESEEADDVFSDSITEDATAADILLLFLKEQKKELLRKKNTLTQATYEFYFENDLPKRDNILKKQFDSAVKIIEKLIEAGVENGEFLCEDCEGTARNIMFVLEGLKISAQTIGVTAEAVDREILYLLRGLGVECEGGFSESAFVRQITGVGNVCERSALLAAGRKKLFQPKTAGDGVTVAIALEEYTVNFG